jgi:hypothetical protein
MMLGHTINDRFVRFINMSNNTLKYLFAVILPLIVGQLFVSCKQGNPVVSASLDRIEQVVQQRPDSALIELVRLDSLLAASAVSIEGDRQMARYALLKTQTNDKNYIDDTNDSLIIRAVRYYDEHGSKRERMLAHFYHGSIFRNAEDYNQAIISFLKSLELADNLSDKASQGMSLLNLSLVCRMLGNIDAIEYADSAYQCFSMVGDTLRMSQSLLYKAASMSYFKYTEEAKAIFEKVLAMTDHIYTVKECKRLYINQCVSTGEYEKASELYAQLSPPYYFMDYSNRVYVDVYLKDTVQAWQDINQAKELIRDDRDSTFYYTALRNVYLLTSDYHNAYNALARKSVLQDSIVRALFSQTVASVQKERLQQQNEHLKYVAANRKRSLILTSFIILLLLFGGIIYIIIKRKEHQRIIETYMENVSDMQRTLLENTDAIATLQQKAEAMDSERLAKEETYRNQIKSLFAKSFHELESLYKKYYQYQNEQGIQREIYKDVCDRINAFAQATQQEELDHLIDENFDHAMEKVKSPEFELSDKELQLYKYKVAGLSARTIRMLMHIESQDALQKRQQRLRKKILESKSPFATELASLM